MLSAKTRVDQEISLEVFPAMNTVYGHTFTCSSLAHLEQLLASTHREHIACAIRHIIGHTCSLFGAQSMGLHNQKDSVYSQTLRSITILVSTFMFVSHIV